MNDTNHEEGLAERSINSSPNNNDHTSLSQPQQLLGALWRRITITVAMGRSKASPSRNHTSTTFPWSWALELGVAGFSLTCLLATIGLLVAIQDQPLSAWTLPISPNAMLAVLSTLSKGTVLFVLTKCLGQLKWIYFRQPHKLRDFEIFDEASRGPLGALSFLYRMRWRAALATTGCLMTIIMLGMEPFTQQILSYKVQTVALDSSDTISLPVSRAYGYNDFFPDPAGFLLKAIVMPANNIGHRYCPGNSCVWRDFTSLDVCSSCIDISHDIVKTCWHGKGTPLLHPNSNHTIPEFICNYTLPDPLTLDLAPSKPPLVAISKNGTIGGLTFQTRAVGPKQEAFHEAAERYAIQNTSDATLVRIQTLGWDAASNFSRFGAHECSLKWCARYHSAYTAVNGTIVDNVTTIDLESAGCMAVPNTLVNKQPVSSNWCLLSPLQSSSGRGIASKDLLSRLEEALGKIQEDKNPVAFPVSMEPNSFLSWQFQCLFNSNYTTVSWPPTSVPMNPLGDAMSGMNLASLFENYAATLTDSIAAHGATIRNKQLHSTISGQLIVEETFIHVLWSWLILPAGVVFLSAVFLLTTIFYSWQSNSNRAIWKNSALATIFHGFNRWTNDGPVETLSEMGNTADETWVRFGPDDQEYPLLRIEERETLSNKC